MSLKWNIKCEVCQTAVQSISCAEVCDVYQLIVRCHGQTKTASITKEYLEECDDDFELLAFGDSSSSVIWLDIMYGCLYIKPEWCIVIGDVNNVS